VNFENKIFDLVLNLNTLNENQDGLQEMKGKMKKKKKKEQDESKKMMERAPGMAPPMMAMAFMDAKSDYLDDSIQMESVSMIKSIAPMMKRAMRAEP